MQSAICSWFPNAVCQLQHQESSAKRPCYNFHIFKCPSLADISRQTLKTRQWADGGTAAELQAEEVARQAGSSHFGACKQTGGLIAYTVVAQNQHHLLTQGCSQTALSSYFQTPQSLAGVCCSPDHSQRTCLKVQGLPQHLLPSGVGAAPQRSNAGLSTEGAGSVRESHDPPCSTHVSRYVLSVLLLVLLTAQKRAFIEKRNIHADTFFTISVLLK